MRDVVRGYLMGGNGNRNCCSMMAMDTVAGGDVAGGIIGDI